MAKQGYALDDYVDVAERIRLFYERFPEGRLTREGDPEVMEVGGKTFIVYKALAYRYAGDAKPGKGVAWEPFPGPTQFTKDSELMNAETAAWGRAIVAVGIVAQRVASREEVEARRGNGASATVSRPAADRPRATEQLATPKQRGLLNAKAAEAGLKEAGPGPVVKFLGYQGLDRLPAGRVDDVLQVVDAIGSAGLDEQMALQVLRTLQDGGAAQEKRVGMALDAFHEAAVSA